MTGFVNKMLIMVHFVMFTGLSVLSFMPLHKSSLRMASLSRMRHLRNFPTQESDQPTLCLPSWDRVVKFTASTSAAFVLFNVLNADLTQLLVVDKIFLPAHAFARNLPISNGASAANRGTAVSLAPILEMRNFVDAAVAQLPNVVECEKLLSKVPTIEKDFKKIFDEHSEGISYKQTFLDQNAFLVYYTKGFDGPGRPSIEDEDSESIKEKGQFGARNDAWVAVDDARGEITFLLEFKTEKVNLKDLKKALKTASKAFSEYLSYDTPDILREAEALLSDSAQR